MELLSAVHRAGGGGAFLIGIVFVVVLIVAAAKILPKAGYSPWFALLLLIPLVDLVMVLVFAFSDWPVDKELRITARGAQEAREAATQRRRGRPSRRAVTAPRDMARAVPRTLRRVGRHRLAVRWCRPLLRGRPPGPQARHLLHRVDRGARLHPGQVARHPGHQLAQRLRTRDPGRHRPRAPRTRTIRVARRRRKPAAEPPKRQTARSDGHGVPPLVRVPRRPEGRCSRLCSLRSGTGSHWNRL